MANKLQVAAGVLVSFGLIGPISAQKGGTTSKAAQASHPVAAPGHGPISRTAQAGKLRANLARISASANSMPIPFRPLFAFTALWYGVILRGWI